MGKKKSFHGVALFVALCLGVYVVASHRKDLAYQEMKDRLLVLEKQKALALENQQELKLQIASQSDPAWVEMVLMRNLGMVPKDQTKVYFTQE